MNKEDHIISSPPDYIGGNGPAHLSSSADDEFVLVSPTTDTRASINPPYAHSAAYNLTFVALWLLVMLGGTSLGWWRTWRTCKRAERAHNDMHITAQTLVSEMRTQICTQHAEIETMREEAKNVRIMSMITKPTLVISRITESRMDLLMADHKNSCLMQPTDPNLRALHDGTVYRWDARSQCWNLT